MNQQEEKVKMIDEYCDRCGEQLNTWDAKLDKAFKSVPLCEDCFLKIYDMDKEAFRRRMERYFGIRPCMGI